MPALTDERLWRAVQDRAARNGWDDQEALIYGAVCDLCGLHSLSDDQREALTGRAQRLWTERLTAWGPT